jgi:predicted alpha-1,2-mannosidase
MRAISRNTILVAALVAAASPVASQPATDYAAEVNPFIGTANGGNTYPGATLPFGMVAFSPEETPLPGKRYPIAAPGGYQWRSIGIKGFSLTHLSGTGCTGASGDVPIMPVTIPIEYSPSSDPSFTMYSSMFDHAHEKASPGVYSVTLDNGVAADLSAATRTAAARFTFPTGKPANLLFRVSDSEVGSSDASVIIDAAHREVRGSVTSGNFCGYLSSDRRVSYYTLYFVAQFAQPFTVGGTWEDARVNKGDVEAHGGTTYGERGHPPGDRGSGAWISFDPKATPTVDMRVGISYVSEVGARANLAAEVTPDETLDAIRAAARATWNARLGQVHVDGGRVDQRTVFYTALYHAMLAPNIFSDADGRYLGFDQKIHVVAPPQKTQYANFSGWDVYRSQLQLLTWLDPQLGSDIAQSLLNQAEQNDGVFDRWTHLTGGTGVMNGDPAAPAIADILAFGGKDFDARTAYQLLLKAATMPTEADESRRGCEDLCVGERPGLAEELKLHYIPVGAPGWGAASDTLEMATADFALSQLAEKFGDAENARTFRDRAGWWRNIFNPHATSDGGYIQPRNTDGSWPPFDPASDEGFVEGTGAQYLWEVPFDPAGLIEQLGGPQATVARLDRFFYNADGMPALTNAGDLHAELNNEPSIGSPWLYDFAGAPWKTQKVVRTTLEQLWTNTPGGISGNDDLGEMSSWYVWAALGFYPLFPGRAELVLGSPLFAGATISRPGGDIVIRANGYSPDAPFISALKVNGVPSTKPWLPESFALKGGTLDVTMSKSPDTNWGATPGDAPPSFGPGN